MCLLVQPASMHLCHQYCATVSGTSMSAFVLPLFAFVTNAALGMLAMPWILMADSVRDDSVQ